MDRPIELIQSSFSFSESAMKYIVSVLVESSKACCLLSTSSAPFTVRHVATGMTPRGFDSRVTVESLNQKSLPCLRTNQRRLQVLMYSPCFISQPVRSGFDQNSTPSQSVWVVWVWVKAVVAARHREAMEWWCGGVEEPEDRVCGIGGGCEGGDCLYSSCCSIGQIEFSIFIALPILNNNF